MFHMMGSEQRVFARRLFEERTSKSFRQDEQSVHHFKIEQDQWSEHQNFRAVISYDSERTFSSGKNSFFFFMSTLIMLFIYIQRK